MPVIFTGQKGKWRRLEVFFAPRQHGKGVMPTVSTYGYHFKKACVSAALVDVDGKAKYTPGSLRHLFASTALANGVPIHEVSRWLGHRSVNTTIDIYICCPAPGPQAFAPDSRALLESLFPDALTVAAEDAAVLGLNAVSDGLNVVLPEAAEGLVSPLRARGFNPIGADLSELLKGGGSVKCCTLEIRP